MNKITKYDVADILVVCFCISYVPTIVMMFSFQATSLLQESTYLETISSQLLLTLLFQFGCCCVGVFLLYLLIVRRAPLIRKIFPESETKEITIPEGLSLLTQYNFWIRLSGITMILREGIRLIQGASMEIARSQMDEHAFSFIIPISQPFVGVVLALLIIWKADGIAAKLTSIGNR